MPKLNEVVEDVSDTTGDGFTSVSTSLIGGQNDIPIVLSYMVEKLKDTLKDNAD